MAGENESDTYVVKQDEDDEEIYVVINTETDEEKSRHEPPDAKEEAEAMADLLNEIDKDSSWDEMNEGS